MVFRETFETQDFRKMCKHAERAHEMRKLITLIERVKQQLADQGKTATPRASAPKPPAAVLSDAGVPGHLGRWSAFER
jgi:hypothetical protein